MSECAAENRQALLLMSEERKAAQKRARSCPECGDLLVWGYDPGAQFAFCFQKESCGFRCVVPDWDPNGLADKING